MQYSEWVVYRLLVPRSKMLRQGKVTGTSIGRVEGISLGFGRPAGCSKAKVQVSVTLSGFV
jgi:hypothetical protein